MSKPSLRIFPASASNARREREIDRMTGSAAAKTVAIPLGKMVPLLLDAARADRAWLSDFADDTVRVDADLYEVLLAYSQMNQREAA
ncbi:hypothetical protein [Rubripirellula reticaptiva]|uniref:Uncharacterized protein n=1 Tax=Rubripirellula reticaptiva TaxID=2528013 RepID=A0A5C6EU38_9BACT|nr:hypothetical protein [Rubripirellula reticaptiva]TWU51894.1 hypothetical protein Poly59_34900 [Rubripirellula reticaptiva]